MSDLPKSFPTAAAQALAADIKKRIRGEVRFDDGSRALYATDASNYRQVPIGVVIPRSVEDVVETVAACRKHGAPITSRGGGTSLAGQCCNTAVIIDMSKYLRGIVSLDPERQRAVVEPGCVLDVLRGRAEEHHLTFGPDPSTHGHNTLGGMIGNNSCGVHSIMAGRTADNIHSLDILTYDGLRMRVGPTSGDELESLIRQGGRRGEIYAGLKAIRDRYAGLIRERFPRIPRRVSGYNLDELLPENGFHVARALVGTEGTCVAVLEAEVRLVPSPPARSLLVLGYPDVFRAGDHVPEILEHGPVGLEGMDDQLVSAMKKIHLHPEEFDILPPGRGWLLVEFGGDTREDSDARARRLMDALGKAATPPAMKLVADPREERRIWDIRAAGLGAAAHIPGRPIAWEGWEDAAVPPARVGPYLRDFRALLDKYGHGCSLYGHFGQGCIHVRIDFDFFTREGIDRYKAFTDEAADLVIRYGGSLSGEHGDGQSRADLLPRMYGEELVRAFREFKLLWDPQNRMNPHKVVDPYPRDSNLRLGADFHPPEIETVFAYPDERGPFDMLRCVGVGACRRPGGGVMCPSYMGTLEEMHSTRGRARLLFEMIHGQTHPEDPLRDGWKSEAVREALDLCLACKGCVRDCPVKVDMATCKAEFYHRYYRGRLRPRPAYSMGLIYWWARAAAHAPGLVNAVFGTKGLRDAVQWLGGISRERRFPRFAPRTFRDWFRRRGPHRQGAGKVLLWPDTFNNHWQPDNLKAAVNVLEVAGFEVVLPERSLCCARPLFAWGMLGLARTQLAECMDALAPLLESGVPVVGLEPACVASFRDELAKLYPRDPRAASLARNSFTLGEFLARQDGYRPPKLDRKALVHVHCNQHAVIGTRGEEKLLSAMGVEYHVLDSGCCGMAGPFGFEAEHYELSLRIGERVLLPAVRAAGSDTLVIADGFSCREQIAQGTDRRALHLAQVLEMALRESPQA
jgi:FAD/FMN-containing dehydrogenase/Fe-S oxidoreductase